jgi:hypothetical protein
MSSSENEAPGSDNDESKVEASNAKRQKPAFPEQAIAWQYSSMAGEGPYPLVLARKDAEPPTMETLPLSRAHSRNQTKN